MGYNTWNDLACKPTEKALQQIVEKLKKLGFLGLGYQYITVDDCWMSKTRDKNGKLVGDPAAFPAGMAAVAKHVHGLGFKFGIYTDRGPTTCVGYPASMGHEKADAQTFAEWGVDMVKNDGCWDPDCGVHQARYPASGTCDQEGRRKAVKKYLKMRQALNSTGREILHSICGWQPWYAPVGRRLGQMWRVGADVRDWEGVYEATRVMEQLGQFHGPNGWNDPDMLLGSSRGASVVLTPLQARAQFSLWAIMAAPLILGVSIAHISGFDVETYSNKEAIQVNQDALGRPARAAVSNCPPYPKFNLTLGPNGDPAFSVARSALYEEDVICGSHHARSCGECPQGHGEGWCHGDCRWVAVTKKCVPLELTEKKARQPIEDSPEPWQLPAFRKPEMRQCQQVWTKELYGGDVALAAINFAAQTVTIDVPLDALGLPWPGRYVSVRDLWYKGSLLNPWVVSGVLQLRLKGDGGHTLLRLRELPNATEVPAAAAAAATAGATRLTPLEWAAKDLELTPAEERLRLIAHRETFRKRITAEMLESPGASPAAWVLPACAGVAVLALLSALLTRPRCRRKRPAAGTAEAKST